MSNSHYWCFRLIVNATLARQWLNCMYLIYWRSKHKCAFKRLLPVWSHKKDLFIPVHQMILVYTRSKVLHICVPSVPEHQISFPFALRLAVFELVAAPISRQEHQMTSMWLWTPQRQRNLIYVLLVSPNLKFQCVSHNGQQFFKLQAILSQVHLLPPQIFWTLQGQSTTYKCY